MVIFICHRKTNPVSPITSRSSRHNPPIAPFCVTFSASVPLCATHYQFIIFTHNLCIIYVFCLWYFLFYFSYVIFGFPNVGDMRLLSSTCDRKLLSSREETKVNLSLILYDWDSEYFNVFFFFCINWF